MSNKSIVCFAAFFALTAVILGAFGAHMLRSELTEQALESYKTGVYYQFVHAISLLVISLMPGLKRRKMRTFIAVCFVLGICFFSGSIYLLSTKAMTGLQSLAWMGPITPIGGVFFISGWLALFLHYLTLNPSRQ